MDEDTLAIILNDLIDDPSLLWRSGLQIMWIPHPRAGETIVQWLGVKDGSRLEVLRVRSGDVFVFLWDGLWKEVSLEELVVMKYEPYLADILRALWRAAELWVLERSLGSEDGE